MITQRRARLLALPAVLLLICTLALSVLFFPAPAAKATSVSCEVTYTVGTQWPASSQAPGGFSASIDIKNTGTTAITSWALHFTFPDGQVIFAGFGGNFTQAGEDVTVTNLSFNGTINPGSTVIYRPGFNANWFGTNNPPTSMTLNGTACSLIVVVWH